MVTPDLRIVLIGAIALSAAFVSADASPVQSAPAMSMPSPTVVLTERQGRMLMAKQDLANLPTVLSFHPWLPESLPAGYEYVQIVWPPTVTGKSDGFGAFIVGPDPAAGTRAIDIHEGRGRPTAGTKPDPIQAFAQFIHRKTLRNGDWQVMQQQHEPWLGEWIYMAWKGGVFIEVDGLAPQPVLEAVVSSLH